MCGRFLITSSFEAMADLFGAAPAELGPDAPRPNVSPTEPVPVVVSREDGRLIVPMRWGLLPPWYRTANGGPLLINARAESIADKPAFATAVRERRCLLPADGFYEW
jgi:putative SOS response-associated peptidase YedK